MLGDIVQSLNSIFKLQSVLENLVLLICQGFIESFI